MYYIMDHQDWNTVTFNKKEKLHVESQSHPIENRPVNLQAKLERDIDEGKLPKTYGHEYGLSVQKARCEKKLTQEQLAQMLNVKKDVVQKVENGTGLLDGGLCGKLFRVLGVKRN